MPTFKSKHGRVIYQVKQLPGCCGVAVVYHCEFYVKGYRWSSYGVPHRKILGLYTDFNAFLHSPTISIIPTNQSTFTSLAKRKWVVKTPLGDQSYPYNLYRSHIIMTDVTSRERPSIYDFCTTMRWKKTKTFPNKKTYDTRISVFERSVHREMRI